MRKKCRQGRKSDGFLSGVLILSLSTVIVKIIGLAYKIPMIAYLGAEGMGYFNSAAEIYAMLCVISTAGLPMALSMLVSAHRERGDLIAIRRTDRSGMLAFLFLGVLGTTFLGWGSDWLARMIGNPEAGDCLRAIAPALLFVCFSSAVRGYFQGFNNMIPTAISQMIEAVGKLVFGVWFARFAIQRGYGIPTVAAFAVLGLTLGTLLSALYLLGAKFLFARGQRREGLDCLNKEKSRNSEWGTLLRIAIPITVSSAVMSVTRLADMALIMRRLQGIGMDVVRANVIYGSYTTLAIPVFSLIPALITPISLVSVPQLSAAIESQDRGVQATICERSVRWTVLLSMPAAMGISVYALPILSILFSGESEAIAIASPLLSILGISILFASLITTTNSLLQSYRRTGAPIVSIVIGALVKIVLAYWLIGIPTVGVYGAPISTFFCNLTVTLLNFCFLGRCVPKQHNVGGVSQVYWKPLGASMLAMLASLAVYFSIRWRLELEWLSFVITAIVAAMVYCVMLILLRCVTAEELRMLPMGEKLIDLWNEKNKKKVKDGHV